MNIIKVSNNELNTLPPVCEKWDNITSIHERLGQLWGGLTGDDTCALVELDKDSHKIIRRYDAPFGTQRLDVLGDTNAGILLRFWVGNGEQLVWFDPVKETFTILEPLPENYRKLCFTGKKCEYVILIDSRVERWRIKVSVTEKIETVLEDEKLTDIFIKFEDSKPVLYCQTPKDTYVVTEFM